MTLIDPHLDVDQVSAAVDGERDAATAAHLLTCPLCREQVEAWRRVLAPLGREVTAPAPDGAVAAAMRAAATEPSPRRVPRRGSPRLGHRPWSAVAVLVVAVALVAALVARHGGGISGPSASSSKAASSPTAAAAGAPAGTGPDSGGRSAAGGPPVLGPVDGTAQLAADLRRAAPTFGSPVTGRPPCLGQAQRLAPKAAATTTVAAYQSPVRLAGTATRVFVFPTASGYIAVVLRSTTCVLFATVRF